MNRKQFFSTSALVLAGSLVLAGCSSADPLATESDAAQDGGTTVVVGSQAYYSNEIVAEIYAQALEGAGMEVERQFSIGQRDAYMPQLEDGSIDVFPEYTGNLLQFYKEDTEARSSEEVYDELKKSLPESLAVLEAAEASDE